MRVHDDLVREGVRLRCRDRRDVILVAVDNVDNLEGRLVQALLHGASHFDDIGFGTWRCKRDIERPHLPANLLVAARLAQRSKGKIRLPAPLLKELYCQLAAAALLVPSARLDGAHKLGSATVDEGLEINVVDSRQGQVE